MTTTVKTSVSLQKSLWKLLSKFKNKSHVINEALEMYFDKQDFLEKADKIYWDNVEKSLTGKDGDYVSINPNQEEVSENLLNKTLWS